MRNKDEYPEDSDSNHETNHFQNPPKNYGISLGGILFVSMVILALILAIIEYANSRY